MDRVPQWSPAHYSIIFACQTCHTADSNTRANGTKRINRNAMVFYTMLTAPYIINEQKDHILQAIFHLIFLRLPVKWNLYDGIIGV